MKIKQVNQLPNILPALDILKHHYPELSHKDLITKITEMLHANIKFVLVYDDSSIVGFATYWLCNRFYSGKAIQIESLIIDHKVQGQGIGTMIIDYIEHIGKENNCQKYILDVYVENYGAQKLYIRKGFHHRGFHLVKNLGGQ